MEFIASHAYDASLERLGDAFLDPEVHVRRYELMGHRDIQVLDVDRSDDSLELKAVHTAEGEVPAIAQKFVQATNTFTTTDRWRRDSDGRMVGHSLIEASSVPGTATIDATLEADPENPSATRYDIVLTLSLTVPLIGDRFVKLLRPQVMEIIDSEFAAWDRWLADVETV